MPIPAIGPRLHYCNSTLAQYRNTAAQPPKHPQSFEWHNITITTAILTCCCSRARQGATAVVYAPLPIGVSPWLHRTLTEWHRALKCSCHVGMRTTSFYHVATSKTNETPCYLVRHRLNFRSACTWGRFVLWPRLGPGFACLLAPPWWHVLWSDSCDVSWSDTRAAPWKAGCWLWLV